MTDRPIIFSAPMIQALLANRKTMTRRYAWRTSGQDDAENFPTVWQSARPGDRLWVRESLQRYERAPPTAQYVADITGVPAPLGHMRHPNGAALWQWYKNRIPSIHMPRWASRLTLVVTATRIEPLREISDEDAVAEGVLARDAAHPAEGQHRRRFEELWKTLHGEESWDANPEVVVVSFRTEKIKGIIYFTPLTKPRELSTLGA